MRDPLSDRGRFPAADDLEGVLNRVPANLPAVPWAEPEELRRRGRVRTRRRLASAGFAGVLAVSLGAVVALGPTWPGASGGTVIAGSAGSPVPPSPTASPTPKPTTWAATAPMTTPANGVDPPTAHGGIAAGAMLVASDLPGGDYQLYDVITNLPPGYDRWVFGDPNCPEPTRAGLKAKATRVAIRAHTYLNAKRIQIDQTVERYSDPSSAKDAMQDVRRVVEIPCGRFGSPKTIDENFVADDSIRYLFIAQAGTGDGTYWTVIRKGSLVSVLRMPTYLAADGQLKELTHKMVVGLCHEERC